MAKEILLQEAMDWCDDNDKSTEFMIEYMQDFADATHEEVIAFLISKSDDNKAKN